MEVAVSAARWVLGRALGPVSDGVLESWAASSELGTKIRDLKMELLYAQGMLDNSRDRDLRSPALGQLLLELRQLAYKADDVMDELEYFRIQDEIDGTYETTDDADARGLVQGLVLNARHTARAVASKLKVSSCSCAAGRHGDPDKEQEDEKQGCIPRACSCGGKKADETTSSPPPPPTQGVQGADGWCMPKVVASSARAIGKRLPCYSFPSAPRTGVFGSNMTGNERRFLCGAWSSKSQQKKHAMNAPKLKFDRVEMSRKMTDIIEQLKPICAKVSTILGLELFSTDRTTAQRTHLDRPKTTPQLTEPKIYGRETQIENVVRDITDGKYYANDLTVLSVVGMGGIGKTTFTQHIYDKVKSHFHVSIWICVSHDFNVTRLAQEIIKQVPKGTDEKENASDEELIEKRLQSKRFLLVLDDMWTYHEDGWKKLLAPFKKAGTKGNTVIVTTRIPKVAKMVGTKDCLINLGRLGQEDCMLLFKAFVFDDQESCKDHAGLQQIGEKIVARLKGSPLAIKTVGRLLRRKLDWDHWNIILESKEWEFQTNDDDIMPALKLSYKYLPFNLQQCFSHCALFPEDYKFTSEELIHFWIGLGLIGTSDQNKRLEDIGQSNLDLLVDYGFFRKDEKENGRPSYVIHDLLHELAINVSSYECLSVHSSNVRSIHIRASVRHLSIIVDNKDVSDKIAFENFKTELSTLDKRLKAENLRTLMLFGEYHVSFVKTLGDLFREAKALRVISLSGGASYNVEDLLHNFSQLLHLRYLRVNIDEESPQCNISRFYHLMVLDIKQSKFQDIQQCRFGLVSNMSNLVNLRHFLVQDDRFHSLISKVGKLKKLQELRRFEVRRETNGFELKQLGQLPELRGSLGIYNLQMVHSKTEADEAQLAHISHLHGLILDWDAKHSDEEHILESLKPHSNLRELRIRGHGGATCPAWLGVELSIENLESIHLEDLDWNILPLPGKLCMVNEHGGECTGCAIGQGFQNLKKLELVDIPRLKKWCGNDTCHLMSHLEELIVSGCPELTELPFSISTCHRPEQEVSMALYPKLRTIKIGKCPNLLSIPPIPWNRTVCSAGLEQVGLSIKLLSYFNRDSKSKLELCGNNSSDSAFWNVLDFNNLTELQELDVSNCPPLLLGHLHVLASLKTLRIHKTMWAVESGSDFRYQFPVEHLRIVDCNASGKELTQLLTHCPNLTDLDLYNCENVTGLGVAGQQVIGGSAPSEEEEIKEAAGGVLLLPPQIQKMEIWFCREVSILSSSLDDSTTAVARGLQGLHSLQSLTVFGSPKFLSSCSSSSYSPFPTSLQTLDLRKLEDGTLTLAPLTNLTTLEIWNCGDLICEDLWTFIAQGHLTTLYVRRSPKFIIGSEPSGLGLSRLQELWTDDVAWALSVPICRFLSSSLATLHLTFNNEVERFTKEQEEALQLLTFLRHLRIYSCPKLPSLPRVLPNLKTLKIWSCPAIQSLPKDGLPSSLEELQIFDCPAIRSLPMDGLPSSLEELQIFDCPAIRSLPMDVLPRSLLKLDVQYGTSEELRRQCRKLRGTVPIVRA